MVEIDNSVILVVSWCSWRQAHFQALLAINFENGSCEFSYELVGIPWKFRKKGLPKFDVIWEKKVRGKYWNIKSEVSWESSFTKGFANGKLISMPNLCGGFSLWSLFNLFVPGCSHFFWFLWVWWVFIISHVLWCITREFKFRSYQ